MSEKTPGSYFLIAAILGMLGASDAQAASPVPVRYACAGASELAIQHDPSVAHVTFAGRTYDLQRKHSSIGVKYISSSAALILDGPTAVFVADDHVDLGTCVKAVPVASR